ncbi:MAG: tRNA adenosine(34) deaminase TadA [Acidobacteriota bacterium]
MIRDPEGLGRVAAMTARRPDPRPCQIVPTYLDIDIPVVDPTDDARWMLLALEEARKALRHGDVPVGAVVVKDGEIVGRGHNRREVDGDPLAHAEILALKDAAVKQQGWRLENAALYVTLEPCAMCTGALVNSRVDLLVFGARDPKAGFCGSLDNLAQDQRLNHRLEVRSGVLEEECGDLLRSFFRQLRRRRRPKRLAPGRSTES